MPEEAPFPAGPTICSGPMLEANSVAPTTNQPTLRPARK